MNEMESWTIKKTENWRIDAFEHWCWEDSWDPLGSREVKVVNPKGNQSWIFIRRADAEAETPTLWPLDGKSWLIGKDPDAWKDWRQKETRLTEDEMVGWHHWLNGHEFEQALGDGESQGSLACCSPWGCKESDMTEWLNNSTITGVLLSSDKKGWKKKPGIFFKEMMGAQAMTRSSPLLV